MKLLLVDGPYYVYRSFFAIQKLTNSRGEPTNAIFGFVKTIRKMLKDLKPDLAAVLWDQGLPKRRTALQPDYKATRAEMPEDMRPQIGAIRELVPQLGLASVAVPDTEADDLMASYTVAARARGHEIVLATNDKDLFQLVDDKCRIYSTNKTDFTDPKDGFALLNAEKVREKWGVPPGQVGEVLALVGDHADNIPGIDGIGPKTAAALVTGHGGLDVLLGNLDAVKNERIREKLRAGVERIHENRQMVRLDDDLPLPVPIEELSIKPRWSDLLASIAKCEFRTLLAELEKEAAAAGQQTDRLAQGELF